MEISSIQTDRVPSRFPDPVRALPGCRSCSIVWDDCHLIMTSDTNRVVVDIQATGLSWTISIEKEDGVLKCNLQELELLRWILEDKNAEASTRALDNKVEWIPQRRYPCLFPHQDAAAHDVLEIAADMTEEELKEAGEQAIQHDLVILCPVPAFACSRTNHHGVDEVVYELAKLWPVRQIVSAPPVGGILDIAPVVTCRASSPVQGCMMFEVGGTKKICSGTRIRTHRAISRLPTDVASVCATMEREETQIENPRLAVHDSWSWRGDTEPFIQSAVLECQYLIAEAQPTRLWDAQGMVIEEGNGIGHYLAVSYCWEEWQDESGDALLREKLTGLSKRLGVRYFWVDRWCILQDSDDDKAREICRMGDYYSGASGCVVLLQPDAAPFECIPQQAGVILSAFQQIERNRNGLLSLLRSKWVSRVWTLQEALMSRQLIYAIGDQLIDGDYISELIAYLETASEEITGEYRNSIWIGGYGCYAWNVKAVPVVYPRQFRIQRRYPEQLTILRTVFGGEQQCELLQSMHQGCTMPFEEALTLVKGRSASEKEDYVYGVLGVSERGPEVKVQYGITWQTMLERLDKAGMITERLLASANANSDSGWSWLPDCASYGPFQNIDLITAPVARPRLSWSKDGVTVLGAEFEWIESKCEDWDVHNMFGAPCYVVRGMIRFVDLPELVARVGGTSESIFTEERISGTQIMMCENVNANTIATIAIQVAGDVVGKRVSRTGGYVLELHKWLEGDVESLRGKKWVIS